MNIYIYISLLLLFAATIEPFINKTIRRFLFISNGIILLTIVGGRYCSTDYFLYIDILNSNMEDGVGWPFPFVWMIRNFNYQFLIFLQAILTIVPMYIVFYRYTTKYLNLLALAFFAEFFYTTLMQQSRQGVSVALTFFALLVIKDKIKKLGITLTGLSFHTTALLGVFPLIIPSKKLKAKSYIIIYIICLLIGAVFFNLFLSNISLLGIDYLTSKVFGYLDRGERLEQVLPLINFKFLIYFLIIAIGLKSFKAEESKHFFKLINILFIGICFYTLFRFIPDLALRGFRYFFFVYIFIIIEFLNGRSFLLRKIRPLIYGFILVYYYYLLFVEYSNTYANNIDLDLFPYRFFL